MQEDTHDLTRRGCSVPDCVGKCWLGWQGSNLRMAIPKTAALPLGYTPAGARPYSVSAGDVKGWLWLPEQVD